MLKRPISLLVVSITMLLIYIAVLPLFGYDLVIHKLAIVPAMDYSDDVNHLLLTRSATFATLAYFCINYLRRKRPLSSVAPMLVFCNFFLLFGLITVAQETFFSTAEETNGWKLWGLLALIGLLSITLYTENQAESDRIFKDQW